LFLRRQEAFARTSPQLSWTHGVVLAGMLLIALLPLILLWDQSAMRAALKNIPILNSAAWPMRWIVIWLPVTQYLLATPVRTLGAMVPSHTMAVCTAAIALIWIGPATDPVGYYLSSVIQSYDPKPVLSASRSSRAKGPIPITSVAVWPADKLYAHRNDTMLESASQALCYNPLYGYRLEAFPQPGRLRNGPALAADERNQTLLFNPACLVHPEANNCKPGDGFDVRDPNQFRQAQRFLARKPLDWERPVAGIVLSWLSQATAWVLFALCALVAARRLRQAMLLPVRR
jgi:hypothetical protein